MRPPERPRTTSGDLNGSKWKIYIYFHLLGSYSMQNVLKKWTKMQIPSTKIVQLVTSKMEAEMDRPWNPSTNNENSCLNAYEFCPKSERGGEGPFQNMSWIWVFYNFWVASKSASKMRGQKKLEIIHPNHQIFHHRKLGPIPSTYLREKNAFFEKRIC